jgi:hypothetical protein
MRAVVVRGGEGGGRASGRAKTVAAALIANER